MLVLHGLVALCSLAGISAKCGNVKTVQNFDLSRYLGTWYENGGADEYLGTYCDKYNWVVSSSGKIQIDNFYYLEEWAVEVSEKAHVPDASNPGQFKITESLSTIRHNSWILGTDYTSYSVEYNCGPDEESLVTIMTREADPPQSVVDKGIRVIRERGITLEKYFKNDQSCWIRKVPSN